MEHVENGVELCEGRIGMDWFGLVRLIRGIVLNS